MKNEFLSTYVANNLRACQLKQISILEMCIRDSLRIIKNGALMYTDNVKAGWIWACNLVR